MIVSIPLPRERYVCYTGADDQRSLSVNRPLPGGGEKEMAAAESGLKAEKAYAVNGKGILS